MAAIVNVASAITPRNASAQKLTRCPSCIVGRLALAPYPLPLLKDAHSEIQELFRVLAYVNEQQLHLAHGLVQVFVQLLIIHELSHRAQIGRASCRERV